MENNMNNFEFRSGRKNVVKSVETVQEANELMRKMLEIYKDDSLWDCCVKHVLENDELPAYAKFDKLLGTKFDVYDTMSIYVNGKSVRRIWRLLVRPTKSLRLRTEPPARNEKAWHTGTKV